MSFPSLRRVIIIADGRQRTDANDQRRRRLNLIASHLGVELNEQSVRSVAEARELSLKWKASSGLGIFVVCSGLFKDLTGLASVAMKLRAPLFGCNGFQVAERTRVLDDVYSGSLLYRLSRRRVRGSNRQRRNTTESTGRNAHYV